MSKLDNSIGEWIDVTLDATAPDYHSEIESFKVYKERVKAKGVRAFNDYVNSIQHGYQLIINRLKSNMK